MNWKYQSDGWRPDISQYNRIIDIGGANSFAHGKLDAIIDIREPQAAAPNKFVGDINCPEIWDDVLEHAAKNGLWNYGICTHTLEDIHNPMYALRMIVTVCQAGLIVVPSKYQELSRFSSPHFRGWIHHHWIWDMEDYTEGPDMLVGFPKIAYIEDPVFDNMPSGKNELVIEWQRKEDGFFFKEVNDGMPFGTTELSGDDHIKQLYQQNLIR